MSAYIFLLGQARRRMYSMNKYWKLGAFGFGIILLLFILQYNFYEDSSWESWNLPLSGKIIYIDPGHGGPDGGAGDDKALEKDIALNISLTLRDYLQEQGAIVLMTRETDKDLADENMRGYSRRKVQDLRRRAEMINESQADFFISVHLNSIPSSKWSGAQTFYHPKFEESQLAAKLVQEELIDTLKNTDRKAKKIKNVYLLKQVDKPGVLVEAGFLSNPTEKRLLMKENYQDKVALSIYKGVMRYYTDELEEIKEKETHNED